MEAAGSRRVHLSAARLLEEDPDLGENIADDRLAAARRDVRARTVLVRPGVWTQPDWPPQIRHGVGLLVMNGLLLRRVGQGERFGAELLGTGDLLRPWQREDAAASVPRSAGWQVLDRARIAILDLDFVRRAQPYPQITGALVARALRRSRHLAVNMAIVQQPRVETRMHMLLWHLADRWGSVHRDGVVLPLKLTHSILAELVAARRPTVSAAIGTLERSGLATRTDSGWILFGAQPSELLAVTDDGPAPLTDGADGAVSVPTAGGAAPVPFG